ncbi:MAG: M20 aminoacylase family protein [Pseudomonadota bacterium]
MSALPEILAIAPELVRLRRDLHRHPELAFEERRTSDVVAAALASYGIAVSRGLAGTGVVGTLRTGTSARSIGLRADMDALPLQELNGFAHASAHAGLMHACGHDGHTAMLLAAAKHLAATRRFDGTVHFVFQPAEESAGGGRVMVEQGLFEQFPVDAVYGMHNMPGIPAGQFAMRVGPIMAGVDRFDLRVIGRGGHAAFPHRAVDAVLVQAQIVTALQSLVARNVDPLEAAVVSITQVHGGQNYNVLPEVVTLGGCIRYLRADVRETLRAGIERVARGVAEACGARIEYEYHEGYPATVNTAREVEAAARAARAVAGDANVDTAVAPVMGAEDFAYMLQARPGAYIFVGNGDGEIGGCMLHNPRYDFNDEVLPLGASYWVKLVEQELS